MATGVNTKMHIYICRAHNFVFTVALILLCKPCLPGTNVFGRQSTASPPLVSSGPPGPSSPRQKQQPESEVAHEQQQQHLQQQQQHQQQQQQQQQQPVYGQLRQPQPQLSIAPISLDNFVCEFSNLLLASEIFFAGSKKFRPKENLNNCDLHKKVVKVKLKTECLEFCC